MNILLIQKIIVSTALLSLASISFADTFYCPNTMRYISTGSTTVQVEEACGSPTLIEEAQEPAVVIKEIQQLFYQPQSSLDSRPTNRFLDRTEINLSFTIEDDRVRTIRLNGEEIASTTLCASGTELKVNDPAYSVLTACGNPGFINYTTREEQVGVDDVVFWTYNFGQFQPKAVFKFVEGVLVSIVEEPL